MVLIDGVGDVAIPMNQDQTPLETANTPMMDSIASMYTDSVNEKLSFTTQRTEHGLNGLMDPVEPALACGSDTAHMSIFGYEPRKYVDSKDKDSTDL